ncbi:hypothetical protein GJ496_007536 [Pomphorhynchus laevis]|nr:hypothetical protein GJ496_007536 [Pomphorhynchus laevis]
MFDKKWVYTEEPHASRRKAILEKYPDIKELMKPDYRVAIQILIMAAVQVGIASIAHSFSYLGYIAVLYIVGGTLNHSLSLGMHEMSHFTAFGQRHRILHIITSFLCNFPLGVPAFFTFKKYHLDHHRYMGDEILDTDIPSSFEVKLYRNMIGKLMFIILQPLSYCLRPMMINPRPITLWEAYNWIAQIVFDCLIIYAFGKSAMLYLLLSTLVGISLHPISGHFISEHYVFINGFETYSYYGPLNWITFNVGYHNEHHDFPSIPGYSLPKVCCNFT